MRVALLGTGTMGAGMGRSMLRAGLEVSAWNRTAERAAPLADDGAVVAPTAAEAVEGADVVVSMLFDTDAVLDVLRATGGALDPGAVWLQTSTLGVDGTHRVARLAEELGIALLDAPVLGTRTPAEEGTLVVLASGDEALRARVDPVLDAVAARTLWVGPALGDASGLKLAVNAWILSLTAAVGQSLALAEALGVDPELVLDAISGGAVDTPYAHAKGGQILAGEHPVSFTLDGALKDAGLIRRAAEEAGVDPGVLRALEAVFQRAHDAGHGAEDMSAVHAAFTPQA